MGAGWPAALLSTSERVLEKVAFMWARGQRQDCRGNYSHVQWNCSRLPQAATWLTPAVSQRSRRSWSDPGREGGTAGIRGEGVPRPCLITRMEAGGEQNGGNLEVPRVSFITWPLPQPPLFCGRDCGGDLEMLDPLTAQILWGGGKRAGIPDVIKLDMVNYV